MTEKVRFCGWDFEVVSKTVEAESGLVRVEVVSPEFERLLSEVESARRKNGREKKGHEGTDVQSQN